MNNIQTFEGIQLLNVQRREVVCDCDAHAGDTVTQIDAQLPNGKPVAIMQDWRGLHVAIGKTNSLGKFPYSQPVTPAQALEKLLEAMK